ncbi:MAG TPA: hypothetical protein VFC65_06910 [Prolixibacteraceae bacterium]|nr:hypothetical protein [Prolixibacteraceae bacterium]
MNNSDQEHFGMMKFYRQYTNHTDDQILEILRNHKDYQEDAVDAAVKIAVERQLIHSEQDLLSPEFQKRKIYKFALFPEINNAYQQQRLTGSIFRFLYVMSFLPIIYGFLKYGKGELNQTYLGVGIGLIWFLLCILLRKTRKPFILALLFVFLILVLGAIGMNVFTPDNFRVLDLVMWIIGLLLPLYMLIYLKRLLEDKSENS